MNFPRVAPNGGPSTFRIMLNGFGHSRLLAMPLTKHREAIRSAISGDRDTKTILVTNCHESQVTILDPDKSALRNLTLSYFVDVAQKNRPCSSMY
jgi:hypothetical protein